MKHRRFALVFCLLLSWLLTACGTAEIPQAESAPPSSSAETPAPAAVERASVIRIQDGKVWAVATEESSALGLFTFPLPENSGEWAPCTVIDVGYSGNVMETYPAQVEAESVTVVEEREDLLSLYFQVLTDMHEDDPVLSERVSYFAFDFSGVQNLTQPECRAMGWLFATDNGREPLFGTWEELAAEGYIDEENLWFEDGVLFELKDSSILAGRFTFDVQKWASGLGAVGYDGCRARKENGVWSYEQGVAWMA